MMRLERSLSVFACVALAGTITFAQGHGHGGPPPGVHGHPPAGVPTGPKPGHGRPPTAGRPDGVGHGAGQQTISEHLGAQPQLRSRLQSLLPPGTNVDQAAAGFTNLGQFVAGVNVSHNLGIPFDALRARVTGDSAVSLGQAIHDLRPSADATAEAARAETEARDMMAEADHR